MPDPNQNLGGSDGEFERAPFEPAKSNPDLNPFDALKSPALACDRDEMAKRFRIMIQREDGSVHDRNGRELFLHNTQLTNFIRERIFGITDYIGNSIELNFEATGANKSGGYAMLISVRDLSTNEYLLAAPDDESPPYSWGQARRIPNSLFAGYVLQLTPVLGQGLSIQASRVMSPTLFDAEYKKLALGDSNSLVGEYLQGAALNMFGRKLDLSSVQVGEATGSEFKSLLIREASGLMHAVVLGMIEQNPQIGFHAFDTFSNTRFVPKKSAREESLSGEFSSFTGNYGFRPVHLSLESIEYQVINSAIKLGFSKFFEANWAPDWTVSIHSFLKHPDGPLYRTLITVNDRRLDSVLPGLSKGHVAHDPGILGFLVTIGMEHKALSELTLWQRTKQSIAKIFGRSVESMQFSTQLHVGAIVASPRWVGQQLANLSENARSSFLFEHLSSVIDEDLAQRNIGDKQPLQFSSIQISPEYNEASQGHDHYKLLCSHQYGTHLIRLVQHNASGLIISGGRGFESLTFYKR